MLGEEIEAERRGNVSHMRATQILKQKLEDEMKNICFDVLRLVENHLLKYVNQSLDMIFYEKLLGDFYRYLAEFSSGDNFKYAVERADKAYKQAVCVGETL